MTVYADNGPVYIGYVLAYISDETAELFGDGIAHGIRNVHRGCAGFNGGLDYRIEVPGFSTGGIHRREFNVIDVRPRPFDGIDGHVENFVGGFADHRDMVGRGADERMDPGIGRASERLAGTIDILHDGPGKAAYGRSLDLLSDSPYRFEVFGRRDRKACFDDVHPEFAELLGDFDLLPYREFRTGRSFGVS